MSFAEFKEFLKLLFGNDYTPLKDDFKPKQRKIKDGMSFTKDKDSNGNIKYTITKYKDGKVISSQTLTEEELKALIKKEEEELK